ncbi:unnamed protein product, partial [Adineta steineri]
KKQEALQKALSYGDTDLALYVLMRMKSSSGVNSTDFNLQLAKLKSLPLSLLLQVRNYNNKSIFYYKRIFRVILI